MLICTVSIIRSQQMQASLCLRLQLVLWSRRTWLVGPKGSSLMRAVRLSAAQQNYQEVFLQLDIALSRMADNEKAWVLPEKYTDDLVDEHGNKMSKRY